MTPASIIPEVILCRAVVGESRIKIQSTVTVITLGILTACRGVNSSDPCEEVRVQHLSTFRESQLD
ncbi:hypothetical protein E2C01_079371 [Portunus trituberculatus]|uniref:Uncharacterized protein n=1 Tax=Portunus trituberculatus TaxID=210409 RepID=A0A5B7ISL0_PORTR|nr:hypothetical protein [Portunus trituberculatus]